MRDEDLVGGVRAGYDGGGDGSVDSWSMVHDPSFLVTIFS
jgi:hypothetical protein